MAFENVTTTTETETLTTTERYRPSFIATGIFLAIIAVLWFYRTPVQAWWKDLRERRMASTTVQLPPPLVALPAVTPIPTPTPIGTPLPTTTATPAPPVRQPAGSSLPRSGPAETLLLGFVAASGGTSYVAVITYRKRQLARSLRSLHVLR